MNQWKLSGPILKIRLTRKNRISMALRRRKANNPKVTWSATDSVRLLEYLKTNSFDAQKLLKKFPKRSLASIRSKVRKLKIENDLFGSAYREVKETFTATVANKIRPRIVFDAYAGAGHQTFC